MSEAEDRSILSGQYQNYMWQDYLNAALGAVILVLAFVGGFTTAMVWTLGLLGAVIVVLGLWGGASVREPGRA